MRKSLLVDIVSYFFILLFLYTGIAKLMEIHSFKEQLASSPLLGSFSGAITWILPIGEITIAIILFFPSTRLAALYTVLGLMLIFTGYVGFVLLMDSHMSCSCGGIIEELSPRQHIFFNSACLVLCLIAITVYRRKSPGIVFRWITGTASTALLLMVGWSLFTAFSAPAMVRTGMEGRLLPAIDLLLPDSATHLNTTDIPEGQPFIVIGFSPWCIHCQKETVDIINHIRQFDNTHIYYITDLPWRDMKTFYRYYKLEKYANITMGWDRKDSFMIYFKAKGIPYITVFDAKKRLYQVLSGEIDPEKLVDLIRQSK